MGKHPLPGVMSMPGGPPGIRGPGPRPIGADGGLQTVSGQVSGPAETLVNMPDM